MATLIVSPPALSTARRVRRVTTRRARDSGGRTLRVAAANQRARCGGAISGMSIRIVLARAARSAGRRVAAEARMSASAVTRTPSAASMLAEAELPNNPVVVLANDGAR